MTAASPSWSGWETAGLASALFEGQAAALLLVEPGTWRLLDANPAACRLANLTRQELLGLGLSEVVRPEQGGRVPLEAALDAPDGYEARGGDRWGPVELSVRRLSGPGLPAVALVALRDRRGEAEALRRLRRAEAELRRLLVSVSDCLWSCRVEPGGAWRYRYLSPAAQRLTGRPVAAFLEDPGAWELAVDPEDRPAWRQFRQRLRDGDSGGAEYRLRRPDGSRIHVREDVLAVREEGELLLHGVISDISERKRSENSPAPPAASPQTEGAWTVLVADDEETVLDVSSRLLRSAGCEVIVARDGEEAVARFRSWPGGIQLALIDLTMPRLGGDATLRELRRLAPALPLVLMSGYAERDVAPRFADVVLAGYLQKPFRLPALLDLLRRVLPGWAPR
jgi:PAS domain S-box-containing protein